jgi:NAD(P)H-hydrate epimerase
MNRSTPLYTASQVREFDRVAIEEAGIPGYTLMTRAGTAAWQELLRCWPSAHSIAVVCGTGNNGGDGYVLARLAREAGCRVQVLQLGDAGRIRGDALTAREAWQAAGGEGIAFAASSLAEADVIVDALLGTGLERPLEGAWLEAVNAINAAPAPVLALDIPSGLQADTGSVLGATVQAERTVTFIGRKRGLYTGDGPGYVGQVTFHDLQVPDTVCQRVRAGASLVSRPPLGPLAKPRPRIAHKGHHGHVLLVGGDRGMNGAVQLAGLAALRTGAGLVSLATRPEHAAAIAAASPELMSHGVASGRELAGLLGRATVVAIGPGLGRSSWSRDLFATVLQSRLPLLLDADALNLLASEPSRHDHWILTPHPGEAGRLLGMPARQVQADRFSALEGILHIFGGVAVLKGAGTLIGAAEAPVAVCASGNPGMATAGMGDVLTGVIAGLIAQGLALRQAATAGVSIHGLAGDRVALAGERGMMATDVIAALPGILHEAVDTA